MADANSIVERLERVSLGVDALEKLGELVPDGAPVSFMASAVQEIVCDVIEDLKALGFRDARLEVSRG